MKTILSFAILICSVFLFASCAPDTPADNGFIWLSNIQVSAPTKSDANVGRLCPDPGSNCKRYTNGSVEIDTRLSEFQAFKSYYDNNNVAGYFNSRPSTNYTSIFPRINDYPDVVNNLINGSYKIQLYSDSSVAIYSNNNLTQSNIVIAYDNRR